MGPLRLLGLLDRPGTPQGEATASVVSRRRTPEYVVPGGGRPVADKAIDADHPNGTVGVPRKHRTVLQQARRVLSRLCGATRDAHAWLTLDSGSTWSSSTPTGTTSSGRATPIVASGASVMLHKAVPEDTLTGHHCSPFLLRRIGFGRLFSFGAILVIHGTFSFVSWPSWRPRLGLPLFIERAHKMKHGSDTDVIDTEGRFTPERFEEARAPERAGPAGHWS